MVTVDDLRAFVSDIVQGKGGGKDKKDGVGDRLSTLEQNMGQLLQHFGLQPNGKLAGPKGEDQPQTAEDVMKQGLTAGAADVPAPPAGETPDAGVPPPGAAIPMQKTATAENQRKWLDDLSKNANVMKQLQRMRQPVRR
jgi:hypothetical protein